MLKLGFLGIVTSDMPASLRFYRALGLRIPDECDGEPHVEVDIRDGLLLAWDTVETIHRFYPGYAPPTGDHHIALAFEMPSPEEVDAVYDRLIAAGHHGGTAPWDAFWGQRYATVKDPDGNSIDLYAALPAA